MARIGFMHAHMVPFPLVHSPMVDDSASSHHVSVNEITGFVPYELVHGLTVVMVSSHKYFILVSVESFTCPKLKGFRTQI